MISLEEFKVLNRYFAEENKHLITPTNWERCHEIASEAENKFYSWYKKDMMVPQKADVIELSDGYKIYNHAVVEDVDRYGLMYICESGMTFTDGEYFSTSGGSFRYIHRSHFEYVCSENRIFWRWGCFGAGGGQGLYFPITVKRFRQKDMQVRPLHYIRFSQHTDDSPCKVKIYLDCFVIAYSFVTINAFKAFAEYVGLTYHKRSDGAYLTDQFLKEKLFKCMEELPEGCRKIHSHSNGRIVECYVHNDGETITTYRPNPNYPDVYHPLEFEEGRKYYGNPLGV